MGEVRKPSDPDLGPRERVELDVLRKFGLRWAVLVVWAEELRGWKLTVPPEVTRKLDEARIQISSGCFSSCTVGCRLSEAEAALVSVAASAGSGPAASSVDVWLERLAQAMVDEEAAQRLLTIPAVRIHYSRCGFGPCDCPG